MLALVIYKYDLLKCKILILLPLVPFDNQIVLDKVILTMTMAKNISKKISVKDSAAKLLGEPPPGDKPLVLRQLPASMLYKTVMRLKKYNKQKYLSFLTQALQHSSKTS